MQTLRFTQRIAAPRAHVWKSMLDPDGYRDWTSAFGASSHFVGSWDEGAKIRFLGDEGGGMASEIAAHRPAEFLSIRHLGMIANGVEDTTSDAVKSWAPAYENYAFADEAGGMRLDVSIECLEDWVGFMNDAFPKALERLKTLCERPHA